MTETKRHFGAILVGFLLCSFSQTLRAQVPGIPEFYQASAEIKKHYFSFSDLAFVIGAIAGLLGGLRVFANWQSGRHHIDREVTGWLFSCIFLNVCGIFLRGLFRL
ncbi:DUF4134 family protein [Pedobacter sp. Leaf250]|uniref:DUF4134 family protein n=1 Tax=Pedobacter sp. Leaf250 TaxID=2876559 RepID=UPI001E5CDC2F|nr:DUF4134 family protein [Pedobacter sp. Leaf250]